MRYDGLAKIVRVRPLKGALLKKVAGARAAIIFGRQYPKPLGLG